MACNRTIFIADAHLTPGTGSPQNLWLKHFVEHPLGHDTRLVLLGDTFNGWAERNGRMVGDLQDALDTLQRIRKTVQSIHHVSGNRDFLVGSGSGSDTPEGSDYAGFLRDSQHATPSILTQFGIEPHGDFFRFAQAGQQIYCTHGDRYCTADRFYQLLLWLLRGPIGHIVFQYAPFALLNAFITKVQRKPNLAECRVPADWQNIQSTAAAAAIGEGADLVFCGHVHHEARRELRSDERRGELFITPPWVAGGYYTELRDRQVTVHQLPPSETD